MGGGGQKMNIALNVRREGRSEGINHAKPKSVTPSGKRQGPLLANTETLSEQFEEHEVCEIHGRKRRGKSAERQYFSST